MSDIVERLREPPVSRSLVDQCREMADLNEEAADEIERLRAALETIRHGTVSGHIKYERVRDFIDRVLDGGKG